MDKLSHPLFVPILSLIIGLLILIFPKILNYAVALYLIVIGIMGILNKLH